jgi:hypothetical protein
VLVGPAITCELALCFDPLQCRASCAGVTHPVRPPAYQMSSYGSCRRAPSFVARLGQLAHPRQTVRHRAFRVHRRASRELSARSQPWLVSLRLGGAAERARAAVRLRASLASASRRASWNLMAGSLPRVHRRWRGEPQKGCQTWDSSCCRAAAPSPDAARLQAASGRRHRRCAARAEPQATRGRPAPAASGPRQAGGRRQAAAGRRPRRRGGPCSDTERCDGVAYGHSLFPI